MSPVAGNPRWRMLLLATAAVASVSLVLSPVLYLRSNRAIDRANEALDGLQASRLELCEQANDRHDKTLRILDREIRRLPASQRKRAERSRAGTVALLEAISPHRDCRRDLRPHKP